MRVTGTGHAPPAGAAADQIVVVPHTHWDREWYLPFQRFRLRLVSLLDAVLERMERDPRWHFTLDGQMAAVDDYLEVRPERRERVAALVREGRLAVGPWQVLHDEFLCSGETIVRNLRLGLSRAEALGAAMPVGYLPDQFGHCAQTPQILRQAGIRHACVWRGVPAEVRGHAFAWEAPDGSVVRTLYLPEGGYGNAVDMVAGDGGDGEAVPLYRWAADFVGRMRPWRPEGGPLLAMYGSDHTAPAEDLAGRVAESGVPMRLDTLAGYVAGEPASADGLTRVRGELRSHARANILPGVISARIHLKQAMGRAERLVERYAEPMAALWHTGDTRYFLDRAWRAIIEAGCHDSVTGCGGDETAEQVAARLAEAEQLGRAVCDLVTAVRAAAVPVDGHLVFNPAPRARTGLVTLDVPAPADPSGTGAGAGGLVLRTADGRRVPAQVLEKAPTVLDDAVHPADDLPLILQRIFGGTLFGQEIRAWTVSDADRTLTFHVTRRAGTRFDLAALQERLRGADGRWRVRILADPRWTVAAFVDVPPLGLTSVAPDDGGAAAAAGDLAVPFAAPVHAETGSAAPPGPGLGTAPEAGTGVRAGPGRTGAGIALGNDLLRVEARPDGTLTLRTADGQVIEGLGRIVDGGDLGDTYNHAPPPRRDRLVDTPSSVRVEPVWPGPLVGAFDVVRTYGWPVSGDLRRGTRADAEEDVVVTMRVELRAGEPFLRLWVTFDNRCDDHRVRLHLPLPRAARSSFAEGQFAVVERGLTAEGGFGERPIPTFPASGFVAAGGLAVLLEHVTEYELLRDGHGLLRDGHEPLSDGHEPLSDGYGRLSDGYGRLRDGYGLLRDGYGLLREGGREAVGEGRELALTLLRSVGHLSRHRNPYRDQPAGPQLATPRAQCRGERTVGLAIMPYAARDGEAPGPEVIEAAEAYRHDLYVASGYGPRTAPLPPPAAGLEISGEGVVMTSLREATDGIEVRVVALRSTGTTASIKGEFAEASRVDLRGRPTAPLEVGLGGTVVLPLRPWEIATVLLRR